MKNGWLVYRIENELLDTDEETLKSERRKYNALYKRQWRAEQKGKRKSFKPFFTVQEAKTIRTLAKRYGLSTTAFIRNASLEKAKEIKMIPNISRLRKIQGMLALIYNRLEENSTEGLEARLKLIDDWIRGIYSDPPELIMCLKETLATHPEFCAQLQAMLSSHEVQ